MKKKAYNPYLPSYEYVPDGEPHVFGDRIYLYGSHDRAGGADFCLNDYVCYSAPLDDLTDWKYEGVIFQKEKDPRNQNIPADAPKPKGGFAAPKKYTEADLNPAGIHALFAPDVAQGPDGRYYLYYCFDCLREIGVAVCDTPAGEFQYYGMVQHEDGTPLGNREGDTIQFDPGVYVEEDGTIYLYSGNAPMKAKDDDGDKASLVMTLKPDMLTIDQEPKPLIPTVLNSQGTGFEGHEFFEASSIRKINGTYYFVYSSINSHELCYCTSQYPDRDYVYGGTLIDNGDVYLDGREAKDAVMNIGNTHGGIECVNGQWYVFYHRQSNRTQYSRQGCAEKITIAGDGSITQPEITSCGLNDGPLEGTGTYPAYICCHLTGKHGTTFSHPLAMGNRFPYLTQEVPDMTPEQFEASDLSEPVQYIANISKGTTAGYKYFHFTSGQKTLTLELRGKCKGEIAIGTTPKGSELGTMEVKIKSDTWTTVSGQIQTKEGTAPLYITFLGSADCDMRSFTIS